MGVVDGGGYVSFFIYFLIGYLLIDYIKGEYRMGVGRSKKYGFGVR